MKVISYMILQQKLLLFTRKNYDKHFREFIENYQEESIQLLGSIPVYCESGGK